MHYNEVNGKYNLINEAIAAASSGMKSYANLDERCIIFTIHLTSPSQHRHLCQVMFEAVEQYLENVGFRHKNYHSSGLASYLDVNGSKFTGADRDDTMVHCHGMIFCPCELTEDHYVSLMEHLQNAARVATGDRYPLVKSPRQAIEITRFNRDRRRDTDGRQLGLGDWVSYAQKEEARISAKTNLGIYLPFDARASLAKHDRARLEKRRDSILQELNSQNSFKVFRHPKLPSAGGGEDKNGSADR